MSRWRNPTAELERFSCESWDPRTDLEACLTARIDGEERSLNKVWSSHLSRLEREETVLLVIYETKKGSGRTHVWPVTANKQAIGKC